MPKLTSSVPQYRRHRGSGQAVVTLNGRDHYLGPHGTKASRIEYDRLIGEWLAAGRVPTKPQAEISLVDLAAAYKRWAATYYVKNGAATPMVGHVTLALKTVCTELGYRRTPLVDFGPSRCRPFNSDWRNPTDPEATSTRSWPSSSGW